MPRRNARPISSRSGSGHAIRNISPCRRSSSGAREQIANELRRIVASVQTDLKRAVQQEQDLAARLAQLKVRSGDVNVDLVTLRELEREAAAKRAVYEGYLLARQGNRRAARHQHGKHERHLAGFPPIEPTGPSRVTITLGGMMLGFIAGIGLGMLRGIVASLRNAGRSRRR